MSQVTDNLAGEATPATLRRRPDGRLELVRDGKTHVVSARRCFPWSEPLRYLSLRDADDV